MIDTPGFGDTNGWKKDQDIFKMITYTIKQLETIDYIFLVNKSTDNRLVFALKSVYERILSMFAEDAKDRFIVMCTFSDGKEPSAI